MVKVRGEVILLTTDAPSVEGASDKFQSRPLVEQAAIIFVDQRSFTEPSYGTLETSDEKESESCGTVAVTVGVGAEVTVGAGVGAGTGADVVVVEDIPSTPTETDLVTVIPCAVHLRV